MIGSKNSGRKTAQMGKNPGEHRRISAEILRQMVEKSKEDCVWSEVGKIGGVSGTRASLLVRRYLRKLD